MEEDSITETFKDIHSKRVDELLFGKTTFDVEDVIAALQPLYVDIDRCEGDPENETRIATQKRVLRKSGMNKVEGALVNVIRSLGKNDQEFLGTFVLYVTGYDYLPVAVPIIVEFNHSEMPSNDGLPVAHTCVHVLKLPGQAYDAKENIIKEKLTMSLNYFKDSKCAFNMK